MTTSTLLQIETDAISRFQNGTNINISQYPQIARWINQAYHYINAYQPWWWTETSINFTLTQGTQSILLNTMDPLYRKVSDIDLITEPYQVRLTRIPTTQLDKYMPVQTDTNEQGIPQLYYETKKSFYVYPVPIQSLTFTARYFAGDPDLVNPTDVPNLPTQCDELLAIWGYSMILQQNFMYDQVDYQQKLFFRKLQDLVNSEITDNEDDGDEVILDEPSYDIPT